LEQEGFRHLPSEVVGCRHDGHGTDAASAILSKTGVAAVQISPAMLRAAAKVRSKLTFPCDILSEALLRVWALTLIKVSLKFFAKFLRCLELTRPVLDR